MRSQRNNPSATLPRTPAQLIKAASEGDLKTVQELLAAGLGIDAQDSFGNTALIAAAKHGQTDTVQWLIEYNADVSAINKEGYTALTVAATGNNFLIVQKLINNEAKLNITDYEGYTPLMRAIIQGGDAQIILELIEAKANVNTLDPSGFTPLLKAIAHGRDARIIQKLIEKRADVNITGKNANTPLMEAIIQGSDAQVAQNLIDNGADVNTKDQYGNPLLVRAIAHERDAQVVQKIIEQKADVNVKDQYGYTPLQRAITRGSDAKVVQKIIEQKADVNVKDKYGLTPLLRAVLHGSDAQVIQNLIDNGADVNAMNKEGYTPLMIAALDGDLPTVESLLEKKATVNAQNKNGGNALFMVSRPDLGEMTAPYARLKKKDDDDNNRLTIVQLLLDAGAEGLEHKKNMTEAFNNALNQIMRSNARENETPEFKAMIDCTDHSLVLLTKAASKGDIKTIQQLLKAGININAYDKFGETALTAAVKNNHINAVKLLLENRAKIEQPHQLPFMTFMTLEEKEKIELPNRLAFTPLITAAFYGHTDMVKLLLANGARADKSNKSDITPLMTAAESSNLEIIRLLLEKNAKVTINAKSPHGITALMIAACRNEEAVKLLVEQGAKINTVSKRKNTALMYAACSNKPQAVKLLIEKKANVNATNKEGVTALFSAAHPIPPSLHVKDVHENKEGKDNPDTNQDDARLSIVKLLVEAKANLGAKNKKGETPLTSSYPAVRNFLRIRSFFENTPEARALLLQSDLLPEDSLIESCMYLAPEEYDEKAFYQIAKEVIKELQAEYETKAPAKNAGKTNKPNPALKEEKNDAEKDPEVKTLGNIADSLKGLIDNHVPHDEKNESKKNQGVQPSAEATEEKTLVNDSLLPQTLLDLPGNSKILSENKVKPKGEKDNPEKQQVNVLAWRAEQEDLVHRLSNLSHQTSLIKRFNLFSRKSKEERAFQEAKTETELTQLLLNQFHRAANNRKDKRDLKAVCDSLPKQRTPLDSESVEALKSICLAIIKNPALDPFHKKRLQILSNTLFSLLSPGQDKPKKYTSGGRSRS